MRTKVWPVRAEGHVRLSDGRRTMNRGVASRDCHECPGHDSGQVRLRSLRISTWERFPRTGASDSNVGRSDGAASSHESVAAASVLREDKAMRDVVRERA